MPTRSSNWCVCWRSRHVEFVVAGRIFLCTLPTDMRKSFDSLSRSVREEMRLNASYAKRHGVAERINFLDLAAGIIVSALSDNV